MVRQGIILVNFRTFSKGRSRTTIGLVREPAIYFFTAAKVLSILSRDDRMKEGVLTRRRACPCHDLYRHLAAFPSPRRSSWPSSCLT